MSKLFVQVRCPLGGRLIARAAKTSCNADPRRIVCSAVTLLNGSKNSVPKGRLSRDSLATSFAHHLPLFAHKMPPTLQDSSENEAARTVLHNLTMALMELGEALRDIQPFITGTHVLHFQEELDALEFLLDSWAIYEIGPNEL